MPSRPEDSDSALDPSSGEVGARPDAPQPGKVVTVLSVSGSEADYRSLGHMFQHTKWVLLESTSCAEAVEVLGRRPVPVVICDSTLPDGDWKDVLTGIAGVSAPPLLIVASRLADDRLWAEVMSCGAFDVLEKPFNQSELVRVVSLAWLTWRDRWQRAPEGGAGAAG